MNKQLSAKYAVLVDNAPNLITALPWGPNFEVDIFRKPDFTALEVVAFATGGWWTYSNNDFHSISIPHSGIPVGINVLFILFLILSMKLNDVPDLHRYQ